MANRVREFWRVVYEQDLSGVVPDAMWCVSVDESPDPNLAIERLTEKARRIGRERVRNIKMQHIRETVLDEGPVRIHLESKGMDVHD